MMRARGSSNSTLSLLVQLSSGRALWCVAASHRHDTQHVAVLLFRISIELTACDVVHDMPAAPVPSNGAHSSELERQPKGLPCLYTAY